MLLSDTGEIRRLQNSAQREQMERTLDAIDGGAPRRPGGDALRECAQETGRQYSNWAELLRCLDSRKPPAECVNLATAYRTSVYIETAVIWRTSVAMQKAAGGDMEGLRQASAELTAMRNDPRIRQTLDAAEGDAQAQLRALRDNYDLQGTVVPDL